MRKFSGRLLIAAIIMLLSAVILIAPQTVWSQAQNQQSGQTAPVFSDLSENHPFAGTITALKNAGIVNGYPGGTFAPDNSISRAEFLKMAVAALGATVGGSNCFTDVKTEWFAPYVCYAKRRGVIRGYSDGSFRPGNNINLAEASQIIAKINRLRTTRARAGEPWYKPVVQRLETAAAIPVTIDYINKKLSRAETAEMIWRLRQNITNRPTKTYAALESSFPPIASCAELQEKVFAHAYKQNREFGYGLMERFLMAPITTAPAPAGAAQEQAADMSAAGMSTPPAVEYSTTNVQVEGVDEADIVKNDSEYIYLVSQRSVRIVRAYPPAQMVQTAKLEFNDENFYPVEVYIDRGKLVVIGSAYLRAEIQETPEAPAGAPRPMIMPRFIGRNMTKIYIVNISDKQNPTIERTVEIEGNKVSSRKIGGRVLLVANVYPNIYPLLENGTGTAEDLIPRFFDSRIGQMEPVAGCADIHFIPRYEALNFTTVASIDISDSASEVQKTTVMGAGDNMYSSLTSLYVVSTRYEYPEAEIFDTFRPVFSSTAKTSIMRFNIENGGAQFVSQGEVPGTVLNQFSMDESGTAFRIATTSGEVWDSANPSRNNLYILDKNNLGAILGRIENIAPGERIYSVRFMGGRAYMVTFKKVDPFFVIDVAAPANPRILGELKIPGFSDYLHPFDENHIIGFGKDAVDPQEIDRGGIAAADFDFAWYQGMKIALFDVTDVVNPRMMFRELIGDRGTDSEVLHNHKALYYDRSRGIFALPVTVAEIEDGQEGSYTGSQYGRTVYQGAYIYSLDLQNGFQLKRRVTHFDQPPQNAYGWYSEEKEVKRIVSIGDYLYTISSGMIKALARADVSLVGSTTLEYDNLAPPILMDDVMPAP